MKTILALLALIGTLGISGKISFAAVDVDNEDFVLEAELEGCCTDGDKRWKGRVQRIVETVDGNIVQERFIAKAAFSTKSYDIGGNKALAKKGVILKFSNGDGPYAECHLPLKNFDVDLEDWKLITSAAFSVSFNARMRKDQWIVKKGKKEEFCDVNLGRPDVHRGIPEIQIGDLIEVVEDGFKVLDGEVRLADD
jgi:hypothetical protein